jgi:adenine phosphoribosyltransferase
MQLAELKTYIKDVPDFPKAGIVFKDISPLLASAKARNTATQLLAAPFENNRVDIVLGIESRGFLFGLPLANILNAQFVMVRKPGKLPGKLITKEYALEYGTDMLELQAMAIKSGDHVLLHDDVLATGGTAAAAIALVEQCGGVVVGASFLIELSFLNGSTNCRDISVHSILKY